MEIFYENLTDEERERAEAMGTPDTSRFYREPPRSPREAKLDELIEDLKKLVMMTDETVKQIDEATEAPPTHAGRIPIDTIIREDLLGKTFTIPRMLFSFLNRALNAHGYQCNVAASSLDAISNLVDVEVTHASGDMAV